MLLNGVRPPLKPEQYKELRKHYEQVGSNFDAMLEKYGIDIIIAPGDCFFTQYATANGEVIYNCSSQMLTTDARLSNRCSTPVVFGLQWKTYRSSSNCFCASRSTSA